MRGADGILEAARPIHRRLMTPVPRGLLRTLGVFAAGGRRPGAACGRLGAGGADL